MFETVLCDEALLDYYRGSDGGPWLTEEIRLCDAMIMRSVLDGRFEESRKWIGTKAGLVRSQPRGDSETEEMVETRNAMMAYVDGEELEGIEAQTSGEDTGKRFGLETARATSAGTVNGYVADPVILAAERVAAAMAVREMTRARSRRDPDENPSET